MHKWVKIGFIGVLMLAMVIFAVAVTTNNERLGSDGGGSGGIMTVEEQMVASPAEIAAAETQAREQGKDFLKIDKGFTGTCEPNSQLVIEDGVVKDCIKVLPMLEEVNSTT